MREQFAVVKIRKPKASRDRSAELFLVGTGFNRKAAEPGENAAAEQVEATAAPSAGGPGGGEGGEGDVSGGSRKKKQKLDDLMEGMFG